MLITKKEEEKIFKIKDKFEENIKHYNPNKILENTFSLFLDISSNVNLTEPIINNIVKQSYDKKLEILDSMISSKYSIQELSFSKIDNNYYLFHEFFKEIIHEDIEKVLKFFQNPKDNFKNATPKLKTFAIEYMGIKKIKNINFKKLINIFNEKLKNNPSLSFYEVVNEYSKQYTNLTFDNIKDLKEIFNMNEYTNTCLLKLKFDNYYLMKYLENFDLLKNKKLLKSLEGEISKEWKNEFLKLPSKVPFEILKKIIGHQKLSSLPKEYSEELLFYYFSSQGYKEFNITFGEYFKKNISILLDEEVFEKLSHTNNFKLFINQEISNFDFQTFSNNSIDLLLENLEKDRIYFLINNANINNNRYLFDKILKMKLEENSYESLLLNVDSQEEEEIIIKKYMEKTGYTKDFIRDKLITSNSLSYSNLYICKRLIKINEKKQEKQKKKLNKVKTNLK